MGRKGKPLAEENASVEDAAGNRAMWPGVGQQHCGEGQLQQFCFCARVARLGAQERPLLLSLPLPCLATGPH